MDSPLIPWVNCFKLPYRCSRLEECSNATIIDCILQEITGNVPTPQLKGSKLRQLTWLERNAYVQSQLKILAEYYVSEIGLQTTVEELQVAFQDYVNTEALARDNAVSSIIAILELLLGASVQGKRKEQFIFRMMQLESQIQSGLAQSIQKVVERFGKKKPNSVSSTSDRRSTLTASKIKLDTDDQVLKLQQQISNLNFEKENLRKERDALLESLKGADTQLMELQRVNKRLECELQSERQKRIASEREILSPLHSLSKRDMQIELDSLKQTLAFKEKQLADMMQQMESYSTYVFKCKEMQDEIEVLRERARHADRLEDKIKVLENRMNDYNNLKKQYADLLGQHDVLLKQKAELDDIVKRSVPQLKNTISKYKDQVVDLTSKLNETQAILASKEAQLNTTAKQLLEAQATVKELEKTIEESKSQQHDSPMILRRVRLTERNGENLAQICSDSKTKEKLLELQQQLASLQPLQEKVERLEELQDALDTTSRLKDKFQTDLINLRAQLETIQQELIQEKEEKRKVEEALRLSQQENESILKQLDDEKNKAETKIRQLSEDLEATRAAEAKTRELLNEKINVEQTLRNNIAALEQERTELEAQIQQLQRELQHQMDCIQQHREKEQIAKRQIEELEKRCKLLELESKLITSAFYNMGLEVYKHTVGRPQIPGQDTSSVQESVEPKQIMDLLDKSEWQSYETRLEVSDIGSAVGINRHDRDISTTAKTTSKSIETSKNISYSTGIAKKLPTTTRRQPLGATSGNVMAPKATVPQKRRLTLVERALSFNEPSK